MIKYKILVKNSSDENLGEFEVFKNLKFSKRLNNYGECSFDVPVDNTKVASLIALRQYTVWVYRIEDGGTPLLIWAGEQASRQGKLDDKGDNWCTIRCYDWLEQLNSRYTADEVVYTNTDAGEIAWDLIDDTQTQTNGDLGITEGTIEATQNRDRTYYNDNILEIIKNLSNVVNGFDFEINTSRVFNVSSAIGTDRTDSVILEYGVNISSVNITEDFGKIINRAIVLGDSGYVGDPLRTDVDDTTNQALYGVREGVINEINTSDTDTLEEKGTALNRKYASPLFKVSMDIVRGGNLTIADFALGDVIRLIIDSGIYDIDETFRIYEYSIKYDNNNVETLDLVLGNFYIPFS